MTLKYSDLSLAFDSISCSGGLSESEAIIKVSESKILYRDLDCDIDEIPQEAEESDDYVSIPDKYYLDLGNNLVFTFIESEMPNAYDEVRSMFRRPGAYGRYKTFLSENGILEKWYKYEEEKTKFALLEWCKECGIEVDENL